MPTRIITKEQIDEIFAQLREMIMNSPDDSFLLVNGSAGRFSCPSKRKKFYEMGSIVIAEDAFQLLGDKEPGIEPLLKRISWTFIYKPKPKAALEGSE